MTGAASGHRTERGFAGTPAGRLATDLGAGGLLFAAVAGLGLLYVNNGAAAGERLFTSLLINATVVVGMQIFIGNTGILSFGHVGFGAVAGYTFVLFAVEAERKAQFIPDAPFGIVDVTVHPVAAIAAAVAVSVAVASIVGLGLVRSGAASGAIAPTVITLSLLFATYEIAINWTDLTGGNRAGLSFRPGTAMVGRGYAYAALAVALAVAGIYRRSRSARLARAAREDDVAARSSGIHPAPHQMNALLLSVALVAIGSSLRVWLTGTISPERFFIDYTLLTVTMLVVGGRNGVTGAVLGTVVITVLTEVARVLSGPDVDPGPFGVILRPGLVDPDPRRLDAGLHDPSPEGSARRLGTRRLARPPARPPASRRARPDGPDGNRGDRGRRAVCGTRCSGPAGRSERHGGVRRSESPGERPLPCRERACGGPHRAERRRQDDDAQRRDRRGRRGRTGGSASTAATLPGWHRTSWLGWALPARSRTCDSSRR